MEGSGTSTLTNGRRPSARPDDIALRVDDAKAPNPPTRHDNRPHKSLAIPPRLDDAEPSVRLDKDQNCDRRRPEEEDRSRLDNMVNISPLLLGKTMTPFLREHIPGLYAPIGKSENQETSRRKDPNSKYCYRHRPDSKCRKAADETKMALIQSELDKLPTPDQQAIVNVWSLFSAAPSRHRDLMLQGIITQCCFPQLSTVSREVHEQLKIDFLSILPVEISQKILCSLDTLSLCRASQVSQRWRLLADSDAVWVRMCQQHIDRKCTSCGWGLPKLMQKRLRDFTRQKQLAKSHRNNRVEEVLSDSDPASSPSSSVLAKRDSSAIDEESSSAKRQCVNHVNGDTGDGSSDGAVSPGRTGDEQKLRSWKSVYKDRWQVGYNWAKGRCSVNILFGHTNGVTCCQLLDDHILATGSYDCEVKIWDIQTGEEINRLQGHTRGLRCLQFDDSKLISGSLDGTIKIWNWRTAECLSTLQCHTDGVISVHFDGDFLASGSIDKTVKIFNFKTKSTFTLRDHTDWVNSVSVDAASRTVLSASDDTLVKLWCLDTRRCIRTYSGHIGHVQQVLALHDFEADDEGWTCVANADAASVTSRAGNTPPESFSGHEDTSATPLPDDIRQAYGSSFMEDPSRPLPPRYMMTAGLDSTIRLWDTASGRCLKTMFGHLEGIWSLAHDTLRVISGANDGMVKVWDPRSGRCERTFTGHRGPVSCVGLSESRMASGGEDGEVRVYSFQADPGNLPEVGAAS